MKEAIIIGLILLMSIVVGCEKKSEPVGKCDESLSDFEICDLKLNVSTSTVSYHNNILTCCWDKTEYNDEQGYYVTSKCKGILYEDIKREVHNVTWRWCVPDKWTEY